MLVQVTVNKERVAELAGDANLLATDLADYLVVRGVPFRSAHQVVGRAVALCNERGVTLRELPLDAYKALSPVFEPDLFAILDVNVSISARTSVGSPSFDNVIWQLERWRMVLK